MNIFYKIFKQTRIKFRKIVFRSLPKKLSHRLIRQTLDLNLAAKNSAICFEVATSIEDMRDALKLLQLSFEREGYAKKTPSGMRLTPYHLLPETLVLIAKKMGRVVATMSLIPRTDFGVPLEACFDIQNLLSGRKKVIEVSSFAIDPDVAGQRGEVLYNLLKFMYH